MKLARPAGVSSPIASLLLTHGSPSADPLRSSRLALDDDPSAGSGRLERRKSNSNTTFRSTPDHVLRATFMNNPGSCTSETSHPGTLISEKSGAGDAACEPALEYRLQSADYRGGLDYREAEIESLMVGNSKPVETSSKRSRGTVP